MTASSQARLVCTPGRIRLEGPLTTHSVGSIWAEALAALAAQPQTPLTLDASAVTQLDSAGLVLLHRLLHDPRPTGAPVALSGLAAEYQPLLERIRTASLTPPAVPPPLPPVERIGAATLAGLHTGRDSVVWTGASASALWRALCHPSRLEGARVLEIMASAGTQALPIVLLIGFLMGTILAFQMGLVAQGFGAGLLVVNGIGIAMLRELGPLMTAIVFAGRSGAAFAAELGTQKVNEEIYALHTFGIDPVAFLVLPRLVAAVLVLPLLTVLADVIGLLGGALVMQAFSVTPMQFYHQTLATVSLTDLYFGLGKSMVFGLFIAQIGCRQGLSAGQGPTAVGVAATRAVVSGLIWIVVIDGLFAALLGQWQSA